MIAVAVSVILTTGILAELAILAITNPSRFKGKFGPGEKGAPEEEVKLLAGRSLTLVGFSGATMTFLLGQLTAHPQLDDSIFLVGLALILFLSSFKLDLVGATRRMFFEAQTRCFSYGLISLSFALALAYGSLSPSFSSLVFVIPSVAAVWDLVELGNDVTYYSSLRETRAASK